MNCHRARHRLFNPEHKEPRGELAAAANENGKADGIFIPISPLSLGDILAAFSAAKQREGGREVAIIAPFSNLTIITTNSIPKEKERGDALIVRMIIWRRQQQEPHSYLPNLPPSAGLCPNGFFTPREAGEMRPQSAIILPISCKETLHK